MKRQICFNRGRRVSHAVTILFLLTLFFMTALPVSADAADYTTKQYNVSVNVNKDNSAYITETIHVDIHNPIHGIYRYIPLSQTVQYQDSKGNNIKTTRLPMKVQDISVGNEEKKLSREKGNQVIRIGNANKTVQGDKTYVLSYKSRMYDDGIHDYDSFFYTVLPYDWETAVQSSTINITMPAKFNPKELDVYAGPKGRKTNTGDIRTSVHGNTITIYTKKPLPSGVGITVGLKLKEGYFEGELSTFWMKVLLCAASVIFALLLLGLWFRFGRDIKAVQTVEFEPPAGLGPAEVGYIIDGSVDKKDVVSMIFWFAQKGFLSIEPSGKKDFILHKEKDLPDGVKPFERTFFDGLFHAGDGHQVQLSQIGPEFADTYRTVQEQVKAHFTESKERRIFPRAVSLARIGVILITLAGFVITAVVSSKIYASAWVCLPVGILFVLTLIAAGIGMSATDRKEASKKGVTVGKSLLSILILLGTIALTVFLSWWGLAFLFAGLAVAILELACYFSIRFMQSRTKYGSEMLGKLLGFKEFIRVAEVEKLEEMVEEQPSYFYDVLPYAYVLGISKKWSKKFESIPTEPPQWYRYDSQPDMLFNTWMFYSVFRSCSAVAVTHVDLPSVDSNVSGGIGGFGGGGGFSGGGFGGGGGGSW